ncbi:MAG: efflux RND transporter periplasmic adaptor subunit, partial [Nitrospira sp.]|nr:efflux RND transporter periplasmic adaptor subunit [Nitrospira sp.]
MIRTPSIQTCLLFLLALSSLIACQPEAGTAPTVPPPDVHIITVVPKTIPDDTEFIGHTESFRPVEIRSQVTGIIEKVFFTEGRNVKKGDKLYLIDPVPFKAAMVSAKGRVGQAVARLARARAELARVKPLLQEQAVSQKDVDDATAEVLASESTLVTAKGDWEKAKFDLTNTIIVAPISGRMERSRLYEGRLVSAQTDLLTNVIQMDPMYVNVNVPESYILRRQRELTEHLVKLPDLFQLKGVMIMSDGSTYPHEGRMDYAGTGFRSETGSLQSRFIFPNMRQKTFPGDRDRPNYLLFPGQFVKLRVMGYTRPNAILIPQRAVQQNPNGTIVFVVGENDVAEIRPIDASVWQGSQWVIEKGLKKGDRVIVEGLHRVRPGKPVNPIPYQEPGSLPKGK